MVQMLGGNSLGHLHKLIDLLADPQAAKGVIDAHTRAADDHRVAADEHRKTKASAKEALVELEKRSSELDNREKSIELKEKELERRFADLERLKAEVDEKNDIASRLLTARKSVAKQMVEEAKVAVASMQAIQTSATQKFESMRDLAKSLSKYVED